MERGVRPTSAATSWMRRRRGSSDARVGVVVTSSFYVKVDVYVKVAAEGQGMRNGGSGTPSATHEVSNPSAVPAAKKASTTDGRQPRWLTV